MTTTAATPEQVQYMAENPVMAAPPGWRLAPEAIGPAEDGTDSTANGWWIEDAKGQTRHRIAETPGADMRIVIFTLATLDDEAASIELWRNAGKVDGGCCWAARIEA